MFFVNLSISCYFTFCFSLFLTNPGKPTRGNQPGETNPGKPTRGNQPGETNPVSGTGEVRELERFGNWRGSGTGEDLIKFTISS